MNKFNWDSNTAYSDMPKPLRKLMPPLTCLDALDIDNQFDHIRYRVQHEIDIHEEEGCEESGMSHGEYLNAIRFIKVTKK